MLDKVCCIIDCDGFTVRTWNDQQVSYRTDFLIRELGYVRVDPVYNYLPRSYRFDLSRTYDFRKLPADADKTLRYQSRVVIGLSLLPGPRETDCLDAGDLAEVVGKMYDRCRTADAFLVGFKGGQWESDLLKGLDIPALDLQAFGCPAFEEVKMAYRDCGHHTKVERKRVFHCPMAEVAAYRDWYMLNVKRYR